ncbi:hypothetical protein, partial [Pseudomonas aeruginosa]|uniref:hypothetical protein n=1 Tax=Pseudomonas aeruginosa TaxID=287 RepID=UPI001EEEB84F
ATLTATEERATVDITIDVTEFGVATSAFAHIPPCRALQCVFGGELNVAGYAHKPLAGAPST